jgi:hypothetical protein
MAALSSPTDRVSGRPERTPLRSARRTLAADPALHVTANTPRRSCRAD